MYSTLTPGQVVLNGGESTTLTAKDGTFVFRDVTPGVYLLEVLSTRFHYSTMRVTLDKTDIIAVEYKVLKLDFPIRGTTCNTLSFFSFVY